MPWASLAASTPQGFEPDPTALGFGRPVAAGGYAWWYVDGLSDDGKLALTIIAFVGSVFSPRYARQRLAMRAGGPPADPSQYCAINVALYRPNARDVWGFTEHREAERDRVHFRLGPNDLRWAIDERGPHLGIEIDERSAVTRQAIRGRVRVRPNAVFGPRIELDPAGRHRWYPIAPLGRIEVEFERPRLCFEGSGYHDVNEGDEGLEDAFSRWNWSRASLGPERSAVLYDVSGDRPRAFEFSTPRTVEELEPTALGPVIDLPNTRWGIERRIRGDHGTAATLVRTLEDTPFYSRNLVELTLRGQRTLAVHESLNLRRFAAPWVRFLLPFRIRRA